VDYCGPCGNIKESAEFEAVKRWTILDYGAVS
jgi:hypothetical protein